MGKYDDAEWVICFGFDIYAPSVQSTKHYALGMLNDGKKVLWINPLPFRNVSLKNVSRTTFVKKLQNKFRTHSKIIKVFQKGLYVHSPLYFPAVQGEQWCKLNNKLIELQISLLKKLLGIKRHFLWSAGSFTVLPILELEEHEFFIYQAADLISDFRGASSEMKKRLTIMEKTLCEKASYIFPASLRIQEKIQNMIDRPQKVVYMPHGVDYEHFSSEWPVADKVAHLPKPVAGYFGSLTDANDKNVLIELAKDSFTVVVIGKIVGDYTQCFEYKNIHFLGPVAYDVLPSYAACFDVCLLNWRMGEWIRNCFPKKTQEYLAMGKPIVSVKIPEVMKQFGEYVYFAETPAEFVQEARRALWEDTPELAEARRRRVRNETWDIRCEKVRGLLKTI